MKKTYFIIPGNNIWNNDSIVERLRTHYIKKSDAIEKAKGLSMKYNEDFIVCSHETRVSTITKLLDYE